MQALEFIGPLFTIAIGAFILYFPIYVLLFIPRRLKARKIGPGAGPSILTLVLYFMMISMVVAAAAPNFLTFHAKSRMSEARQNMGAIFTCQVAYFGEMQTYGGGPDAFKLIYWAPEGSNMYAYYCGDDMIENRKYYKSIEVAPGPDWPYSVRPGASGTGFTCMALGNIDNDDFRDVWSMNDAKVLTHVHDDVYNDRPPGSPLIPLAIFFSLLLLSFINDYRRRKKALAKFKEEEALKSESEVNEGSSKQ